MPRESPGGSFGKTPSQSLRILRAPSNFHDCRACPAEFVDEGYAATGSGAR
jgi:hypothetical protein